MTRREIRPNDLNVECAVCGRSLLRGELSETYIHGGERVEVCELCTGRAEREGWIREAEGAQVGARARPPERGSILRRLRGRRERGAAEATHPPVADARAEPERRADRPDRRPERRERRAERSLEELLSPEPRTERHVHAVPTSDDLKISRALELFNDSEHPRTVAGVARSLGAPLVSVRPSDGSSIVLLTIAWELCWYRYEVDLADEAGGVRIDDQGYELSELDPDEHEPNAAADDRGVLAPAAV